MGVTRNAQLANRKLITIVLYESGGVISKVHTEDIAIKAHEMFPDSFSWTKYPDRVDKDIVRVALVEAARQLNGAMVDGRSGRGRGHTKGKSQPRETDGWKLTETGIAFAKENIEAIVSAHRRSDPKSHRQEQQRVLGRVRRHPLYLQFETKGTDAELPLGDMADLLRCRVDAEKPVWSKRIDRIRATAQDASAQDVVAFANAMASRVGL